MKVYLSAQFGRREELRQYRHELQSIGWDVVSSWLDEESDKPDEVYAAQDAMDMEDADAIIMFTGPPYVGTIDEIGRGGHLIEFGWFWGQRDAGKNKTQIVIGPAKGFEKMPHVAQFPSWEAFKNYITL